MEEFNAFAEAQAINLGDLTLESDEAQLAIYGQLALTPDPASLERLDRLIALLAQARAGLVKAMDTGTKPAPNQILPTTRNPFA
jgi:hypothetical protein